jgi:abequosyltransferase
MTGRKLLTISIPTYNRAECLDLCLAQLCNQTDRIGKDVELIVSDNASPDETPEIVAKYRKLGVTLTYLRNHENLGGAANVYQCFKVATGKYVLVLADDDLLVDGAMNSILTLLEGGEYGVVHLRSYSFLKDFRSEKPRSGKEGGYTVFRDKAKFIKKVNLMLTFISGNIVNKTLVDPNLDIESFCSTNLPQMSWILSALIHADKNLYINDRYVAAKAENTGGYQLCNVFGVHLRSILTRFEKLGAPPNLFNCITSTLLSDFLPGYILKLRSEETVGFHQEDFYATLAPIYRSYYHFWLVTVPAIRLPLAVAKPWYSLVKKCIKLGRKFRMRILNEA